VKRDEFLKILDRELENVRKVFAYKNVAYGREDEAFYNFKESARRQLKSGDPKAAFKVLQILADKHEVALANVGFEDPECPERLRDIIVYSLIGLGLYEEYVTEAFREGKE